MIQLCTDLYHSRADVFVYIHVLTVECTYMHTNTHTAHTQRERERDKRPNRYAVYVPAWTVISIWPDADHGPCW